MNLIVGLGNPGRVYVNNRHNAGFVCVNHFARTQGIQFDKKQGKARIGQGNVAGSRIIVARPQTYMNLSGESVSRLVRKFNINPNNLLVIHDDLDLPLGKIRIRQSGGSGGHKGIDSIIDCVESENFLRLRVGIGRPNTSEDSAGNSEADIVTYVLSDFTPEERQTLSQVIPMVSEAILCLLTEGLTATMNRYN